MFQEEKKLHVSTGICWILWQTLGHRLIVRDLFLKHQYRIMAVITKTIKPASNFIR